MERNAIIKYKNSIVIHFAERAQDKHNDPISVFPHYNAWMDIMSFMSNRGWEITENEYFKKEFNCLSKYHKIGFKKDVACLLEITGDSVKLQFGHIKNLWKNNPQSFWEENDSYGRNALLTYLEKKAVLLEQYKVFSWFQSKYNHFDRTEIENPTPEQYIIDKDRKNTHIHGKVDCLNDIKLSITEDSYNYRSNSDDRDKKKIICGQVKYFYDYNRRLYCGVVWHNINNMWWVICGNKLKNVACFNLFDYVPGTPFKNPLSKQQVERLLKKFEDKRDYARCKNIFDFHNHVMNSEKVYA